MNARIVQRHSIYWLANKVNIFPQGKVERLRLHVYVGFDPLNSVEVNMF